jgi:large conductance mechanosensitive channel
MLKEFKDFVMRGNVLDLAIAVIIGGAFGAITKSLVDDVLMPPIGLLLGKSDFSELFLLLQAGIPTGPYPSLAAAKEAGAVTLNYGLFLNTIINFIIIAFAMFMIVRVANRLQKTEETPPPVEPTTKDCPYCMTTIHIKASRCPNCTSEL